jgi:hypothetical protein
MRWFGTPYLLRKEPHTIVGQVQLESLPKYGIEGLPGALVSTEWANAETGNPSQPATACGPFQSLTVIHCIHLQRHGTPALTEELS